MTHDLIIIGAGPAGMSAAITAADLGLRTLLLDEQTELGGQIYRNVARTSLYMDRILGADYVSGRQLVSRIKEASVDVSLSSTVWNIEAGFNVHSLRNGKAQLFRAPQLIVASGALERPSPIPGWSLPGVLNAGAAQIAMKSAASIPAGRIALVGGGPLLLLVACQLLDAGANVVAVVETSPAANLRQALRYLPGALRSPKLLAKGLAMTMRLKGAGVIWHKNATALQVGGNDKARSLSYEIGGRKQRIDIDTLLLHHGVIPNTQISRLLQADHEWNDRQLAWQPCLNNFNETSIAGFRIAGDGGGIGGAWAAEASGRLAAIGAANALGRPSDAERDRMSEPVRQKHASEMRIRPFLDALYRPPQWLVAPRGEIAVCRCEEVTATAIRQSVVLGSRGPNQTKFYNRCGMGPCQGRICGPVVTQILADELSLDPSEIGAYRVRAPLKPITLQQVASLRQQSK